MFSKGLLIGKRPFQGEVMCGKNGPFLKKLLNPTTLQLNIQSLTASKINVLHYLPLQSEALFILLWETHCTDADKLLLSSLQLAGSFLSRKHGLATFVYESPTFLDQSPPTPEIGWLCVNVNGYKIANVY